MKSKNEKEIRISFYKFIVVFLVTFGFMIALLYLNLTVPIQATQHFEDKNKVLQMELNFQKKFNKFIKIYFDSLVFYEKNTNCEGYLRLKKNIDSMEVYLTNNQIYHQKPMYDSLLAIINSYHEFKVKQCYGLQPKRK